MPPKKDKAAVQPKRRSSKASVEVVDAGPSVAVPSGASWNAEIISQYNEALKAIKDFWPGIENEAPSKMGDGGAQAPFDGKSAKSALGSFMEEYVCANNFFKCELEFNVDPNVPIRASMVEEIKSYYYKDAALFAEPFEVSVPSAWLDNMSKLDMVKPIVSIEHRIAFVLAIRRDFEKPDTMETWRHALRNVGYTYKLTKEDEVFWMSINSRQDKIKKSQTMSLTCIQRIFSVLNHKARHERTHGEISVENFCVLYEQKFRHANESEKVSDTFLDTAVTVGRRVLRDAQLVNLLLQADEHAGSPFNDYSKLQVLVSKGKTQEGIRWVFNAMWDGYFYGWLKQEFLTKRALEGTSWPGGTAAMMIGMMELKNLLLGACCVKMQWDSAIKIKMMEVFESHDSYRRHCGANDDKVDLTWKASWPKSALHFFDHVENCCFNETYLACYKQLLKNRKQAPDWPDHADIDRPVQEALELYEDEEKQRKKAAGELQEMEKNLAVNDDADEEKPKGAEVEKHAHLKVALPGDTKNKAPPKLDDDATRKLLMFKEKAMKMVRTHVLLVNEDVNVKGMTKALRATKVPEWKGEVSQLQDQTIFNRSVAIYFDSKLSGEAATQPSVRMPPLREGRLPKLMQAALACRMTSEGCLPASDVILLLDGGREGVQSAMLGSIKGPEGESINKVKSTLMLHVSESSLRSRRKRDKGHHVYNAERVYIVTSDDGAVAPYRDRCHYGGSTRGEIVGPIQAPSWEDESETWIVTFSEKKDIYGNQMVRVGGKNEPDDDGGGGRRQDSDKEPMSYHALPEAAVEEFFHAYNIQCMLDLSVGDGKTCMLAIKRRAELVGITFNDHHKEGLYRRLEAQVFQEFQKADSPLYESGLVQLLGKKRKAVPKPKPSSSKKKKTDEDEEDLGSADEGPSQEEDGDEDDEADEDDDEGEDMDEQSEEEDDEGDEEVPNLKKGKGRGKGGRRGRGRGRGKAQVAPKKKAKAKSSLAKSLFNLK